MHGGARGVLIGLAALTLLRLPLGAAEALPPEADDTSPLETLLTQSDRFQSFWSRSVRRFSSNVDTRLSHAFTDRNDTAPEEETPRSFFLTDWFNRYFVDTTYFDPANRSYIRMIGTYGIGSKSPDSWYGDLRARIILPQTRERWQLFIGDETRTGTELSAVADDTAHSGVGLSYIVNAWSRSVNLSGSVGFSRITNPYARIRAGLRYAGEGWLIEPVQTLRYSADNDFEEWTNLLLAYQSSPRGRVQLMLQRAGGTNISGTEYLAEFSYTQINRHGIGIKPYVALFGRSRDVAPYGTGEEATAGVYNYAAGLLWKRPVGRPYIFYQIHPGVQWHEAYGYSSDWLLRFSLEYFIGVE